MEDNRIMNRGNFANSLQISEIGNIPTGEFSIDDTRGDKLPFLVKNITEDPITVEVILAGMETAVTTVFYAGWNVELVKQVNNAQANTLQYGF